MPSALDLDSEGRVIARFMGSPDAIQRIVADLGWRSVDASVWAEHSRSAPERWARIAVPKDRLREMTEGLREWWASPGAGVAYWAIDVDADAVKGVRARAEAAGGSLVMLAAPEDFMREVGAWGAPPSTLPVMQRLKDAFDPGHVLNPGRFVV